MNANIDRLYELIPAIHRIRDAEQGEPLKALLRVITEQVDLVEEDIARLYDNWFIETCEDWVVPYIGDLIGYRPIHEAGEPGDVRTEEGRTRNKILIPRREVANTVRYRRRKGTLALLELLANDVAGWPARAVEIYKLLGWTQSLNHLRLDRGRTVDVRTLRTPELINGPFDELAHTVDVRRISSPCRPGRYNIPSVGLFVWRLKTFSVTQMPAYCVEGVSSPNFTFSVLGNDTPLFLKPEPEADPTHIAEELNLPVPIRRRLLHDQLPRLYGPEASFCIWKRIKRGKLVELQQVEPHQIVPADLSGWHYLPRKGTVAVDPLLGRIAFPARQAPKQGVWVSYRYGFSAELGGGEYERSLSQPAESAIYHVGQDREFKTLREALDRWTEEKEKVTHAVIEIGDSGVYSEPIYIEFSEGQESLQLRAANGKRPVIWLTDRDPSQSDAIVVTGPAASRFTLDGLLVCGRGLQLCGDLQKVTIRHATLVPGWDLDPDCVPRCPAEPSLEVFSPNVCVNIEHSILGPVQINPIPSSSKGRNEESTEADEENDDESLQARCHGVGRDYRLDPIRLCMSDSILDSIDPTGEAIGAPGCPVAHAVVTMRRCTVFGQIQAHAIELGENSIFHGRITVARRQIGCLRFCYVTKDSRTPRRYYCQPDLIEQATAEAMIADAANQGRPPPSEAEVSAARQSEQARVRPQFTSRRYGTPTYCQLAASCSPEIARGADDESEMGVFHDLFQPQREANLRARLNEYVPAGADVGIILAN